MISPMTRWWPLPFSQEIVHHWRSKPAEWPVGVLALSGIVSLSSVRVGQAALVVRVARLRRKVVGLAPKGVEERCVSTTTAAIGHGQQCSAGPS